MRIPRLMGVRRFKMNLSQLPPQKKRVLAIGFVAFIVLLFVSFLLSLLEDDNTQAQVQQPPEQAQTQGSLQLNKPQVPSSQRYDFNQSNQQQGAGLEQLLNNEQEIGVNNDPFSGMNGQGTEAPSYGPAPLPTPGQEESSGQVEEELSMPEAPAQKQHTLYCDEYATPQEAESQKAMLAFQGVSATVVQSGSAYRLKIGPYPSNEAAKKAFNELGTKHLVQKCSLIAN